MPAETAGSVDFVVMGNDVNSAQSSLTGRDTPKMLAFGASVPYCMSIFAEPVGEEMEAGGGVRDRIKSIIFL